MRAAALGATLALALSLLRAPSARAALARRLRSLALTGAVGGVGALWLWVALQAIAPALQPLPLVSTDSGAQRSTAGDALLRLLPAPLRAAAVAQLQRGLQLARAAGRQWSARVEDGSAAAAVALVAVMVVWSMRH